MDKDGGDAVRVWGAGGRRVMCVNSVQENV